MMCDEEIIGGLPIEIIKKKNLKITDFIEVEVSSRKTKKERKIN